jgi:hypothetical protein
LRPTCGLAAEIAARMPLRAMPTTWAVPNAG